MSDLFKPISISWGGNEYTIPADRIMGAIASVEDIMTLKELGDYMQKNDAPLGKLAMAFGTVLRYAGARVRDEEIYSSMFEDGSVNIMNCLTILLTMMLPPQKDEPAKKVVAPTE